MSNDTFQLNKDQQLQETLDLDGGAVTNGLVQRRGFSRFGQREVIWTGDDQGGQETNFPQHENFQYVAKELVENV